MTKDELLQEVRALYRTHGIEALSTPFLEKRRIYSLLLKAGLYQPTLLIEMGLADEYAHWKSTSRKYRGVVRLALTWDQAIQKANEFKAQFGDLPTLEWFRRNGHTSLANAVYRSGHSFEDLRAAVGSFANSQFRESGAGIRWRSYPEASLSDFLYARGIIHKRGERYDQKYSEQTGRHHGTYDLHFKTKDDRWIDVEIWGDLPDKLTNGRYGVTRKAKEDWHKDKADFLGIQYKDCLSDERLTLILQPYIGVVEPFQFDKPQDRYIETAHWTDADELIETCRQFAATMPDGIFPGESWLRKRGKYANRPGETYNTLAIRVHQWLGGTRAVRKLLGHGAASTIKWTATTAIQAWRDFEAEYGLSPTTMFNPERSKTFPDEVLKRAQAIRQAAVRHGVLNEARKGKTARKTIWTEEVTIAAWRNFEKLHGISPSSCTSLRRRNIVPRELSDEATRIYSAARKLGLLETIRGR